MLIKCPECGHEVSDKAPVCPHCGIEIAKHFATNSAQMPTTGNTPNNTQPPKKEKSNKGIYIASFLISLVVCGGLFYHYMSASSNDEQEQYEIALQSEDTTVLQAFLDNYRNAPREHRDSIQARLSVINQVSREWNDAVISGTRSALQLYIQQHPGSEHEKEALHLIDSIDWNIALSGANTESLQKYVMDHPNGDYIDEANQKLNNIKAGTVQPEEKTMIGSIFRTFFQAINMKDEDRLTSTVTTLLTSFLSKNDATKSDVIIFMKKLWKEDVQNLNWRISDDYMIDKKPVGEDEYEYNVTFSAVQDVERESGESQNQYRIKAKVNTDGKITEFNMSRVVQN